MADFTLVVGVDTSRTYTEMQSGINAVVAKLNANPPKIKVEFDKASLATMRTEIESLHKSIVSGMSKASVNTAGIARIATEARAATGAVQTMTQAIRTQAAATTQTKAANDAASMSYKDAARAIKEYYANLTLLSKTKGNDLTLTSSGWKSASGNYNELAAALNRTKTAFDLVTNAMNSMPAEHQVQLQALMTQEANQYNLVLEQQANKERLAAEAAAEKAAKQAAATAQTKAANEASKEAQANASQEATANKQASEAERAKAEAARQAAAAQKTADAAIKAYNSSIVQGEAALRNWSAAENSKNASSRQAYQALHSSVDAMRNAKTAYDNGTGSVDNLRAKTEAYRATLKTTEQTLKANGDATKTLSERLGGLASKFTAWLSVSQVIMYAVRAVRQMVEASVELDRAMTQMQIVTRASDAEMEAFGNSAAKAAKRVASTITDYVDSATTYARLGYTMLESGQLAEFTAMLQNVGDIDVSDAQDAITAIIKAFNVDAGQIESVMDKLVTVGNNFPISVSQIAEGMNNASSTLAASGNTFEQSVALLTAANVTIQDAAKSSTGLRTIAARIRNTTTELDDLGEVMTQASYEELVQTLTDCGVALTDINGEYRSTYDIMADIAAKWDELDSMRQAALATALSGTRQQAVFYSIIEQFQEASGAMDAMATSAGALDKAYSAYLDSAQAHITQFKATFEELSANLISSGFISDVVDFGTTILEILNVVAQLIDKVGGLNTVLVVTAGVLATIHAETVFATLAKIPALITKLIIPITRVITIIGRIPTVWKSFNSGTAVAVQGTSRFSAALQALGISATSAQLAMGALVAIIAAAVLAINKLREAEAERRASQESEYNSALANAREGQSLYDLYVAYERTKSAYEQGTASKEAMETASRSLAEALELEGDAAVETGDKIRSLTLQELARAVDEAEAAEVAAQKMLSGLMHTYQENTQKVTIRYYAQKYDGFSQLWWNQDDAEAQANELIAVYRRLIEDRNALIDAGETDTREYDNIIATIEYLESDVLSLNNAREVLTATEEQYNNVLQGTTAAQEDATQAAEEATSSYSSLAEALEGFDDVSSKIETLSDAIEKLGDGELGLEDVIDLIMQFPELADYVDFTAENFGNLDEGLRQLRNNAPEQLIENLRQFAETADLTDEQRASIEALCAALDELPNVDNGVDELTEKYGGLADVMERAKKAADELSASIDEDNNDAYVTRAKALEEMISLMEHGAVGSESKIWQIAKNFGLPDDVVNGKDADALAELIALRQQWYDGATDDRYSYEGIQSFIGYVTRCRDAFADLGVTFEYVNGELTIDIPTDKWYAFADSIGVSSDELADLLIQIGQFYGIDFSDVIPAELQAPEIEDPDPITVTADTSSAEASIGSVSESAGDATSEVEGLTQAISNVRGKTVTVTARVNGLNNVISLYTYIRNLPTSKSITVTTYNKTVSSNATRAVAVNGTAHASGTWGSAFGGRALVGELGREIYVDPATSRWQTVGDNGAEFINVRRGGIIFNHRQTEALLANGYVTGRGHALASGTALVSGGGSIYTYKFDNNGGWTSSKATTGGYSSSKSSGYSTSSSTTSKTSTNEDTWFEKLYKYHNHLLNMEQESVEDYIDWLDSAYQKAYNEGILELEDFYQYQEEVFDKLRDVFEDYLGDIEHNIDMREAFGEDTKTIISLYRKLMSDIEKELKAAYAAGLDDNNDYVQRLQSQWVSYRDTIVDLQQDIIDAAKDALDRLIDYRIDMMKQDVNNDKDALNKKLDNLKEFYDKQKQLLQDVYDEEKYLDEQSEKRRSVTDIQAQIARLEYDDSAWAQKRKLELRAELADAQKELDDFEREHALDTTLNLLEQSYNEQEAQIQKEMDALEEVLNDPEALYNAALEDIRKNGETQLYYQMLEYNRKYGTGNDETVNELWESVYGSLNEYQKLLGKLYKEVSLADTTGVSSQPATSDNSGYENSPISPAIAADTTPATKPTATETTTPAAPVETKPAAPSLYKGATVTVKAGHRWYAASDGSGASGYSSYNKTGTIKAINTANWATHPYLFENYGWVKKSDIVGYQTGTHNALPGLHGVDELGPEYLFTSSDGSRYRVFSGGEKVLNAKATEFLYDFANNGREILSKMAKGLFDGGSLDKVQPICNNNEINMGDVIVQGNADRATISEIRRAQRDSLETMLREFNRLNK